jgi:predicted transcriptional regulator
MGHDNFCHHFASFACCTFIVSNVPTILRGNAEDNSWYRGDNKSAITRISSLQVFYYTEQLFALHQFYCNKITISIVSFNLSEKYYTRVNSTHDYSPTGE